MRQLIVGIVLVAVLLVAGFLTNYWLAINAVDAANRSWCPTLLALTERPVPRPADPQANPSRENAYRFYVIFLDLRGRFGCNS